MPLPQPRLFLSAHCLVFLLVVSAKFGYSLSKGSSSKTPVTKPDGTKMFRSVFLNDAKRCCFFTNIIVKYYYDHINNLVVLWKSCSMAN